MQNKGKDAINFYLKNQKNEYKVKGVTYLDALMKEADRISDLKYQFNEDLYNSMPDAVNYVRSKEKGNEELKDHYLNRLKESFKDKEYNKFPYIGAGPNSLINKNNPIDEAIDNAKHLLKTGDLYGNGEEHYPGEYMKNPERFQEKKFDAVIKLNSDIDYAFDKLQQKLNQKSEPKVKGTLYGDNSEYARKKLKNDILQLSNKFAKGKSLNNYDKFVYNELKKIDNGTTDLTDNEIRMVMDVISDIAFDQITQHNLRFFN